MEQDYRQRSRRRELLVLDQKAYRINVSLGFLIWAFVLLSLVFVFEIPTFLKRDDFSGIAQIAADVSAICLALLTLVHELGEQGNKYLKLALAALSLDFVLATLLSVLVLATTGVDVTEPFKQTLTVVILIWVFAGIGLAGVLSVGIGWFVSIIGKWLRFLPKIRLSAPRVGIVGFIVDYSTFILPFVAIALWASPLNLVSATLILMIGGLANTVALSVIFAVQTVRQPKTDEDKLKPIVLESLRDIHSVRCTEPASNAPYEMVNAETLMTKLAERQLFRNESTIRRLIQEMQEENLIFANYNSCYIFPTKDDIDKAVRLMDSVDLAITGYGEGNSSPKICANNVECTFLAEFLSRETRYPLAVVEIYFLPNTFTALQAGCDFSLSVEFLHGYDKKTAYIALYARSERIQALWGQIVADNPIDPETDSQFWHSVLLRNLADALAIIPTNPQEMKKDQRCIVLFINGIGQLLSIKIIPT